MTSQIRVKLVSKPLNSKKYHLATFNSKISDDYELPRHILEEATESDIKERNQQSSFQDANNVQIESLMGRKKNAKLKYLYEEIPDNNNEPKKFSGFQDDGFNSGSGGNATYAIMIYDAKRNVFQIAPLDKHYKFERQVDNRRQRNLASNEEVKQEHQTGDDDVLKQKIKQSRTEHSRKQLSKRLTDFKKNAQIQSKTQGRVFTDNARTAALKNKDSGEVAKRPKKKKKGLTEKDLDYEEIFDDDNDEDAFPEDDDDVDDEEEDLSDDGKKVQEALQHNRENEESGENQAQIIPARLNLNFEREEADQNESGILSPENEEEKDSSIDSLFEEDEDDDNIPDIGGKRSATQSSINYDKYNGLNGRKRPKND